MNDTSSLYLTCFQRKLLEKQLEKPDLCDRYRKRIQIMLRADAGDSQAAICKALGCCASTVRHWMLMAQSGQAHAWFDRPMGRPKTITDGYTHRLKELIEHGPRAYGYVFHRWTASWLSQHLHKEFDIQISDRHINRLLNTMGLSTRSTAIPKPDKPNPTTKSIQSIHPSSAFIGCSSKLAIDELQPRSDLKFIVE